MEDKDRENLVDEDLKNETTRQNQLDLLSELIWDVTTMEDMYSGR